MDVSEAIVNRKSVRAYEDRPVPADVLKKIIEAGQWAPNAGPFQISVIQNAGLRQRINNRAKDAMVHSENEFARQRASLPGYEPIYGAPVLILLSAPADAPLGVANTALAAENMLLEATGLGLGSCFLMITHQSLKRGQVIMIWLKKQVCWKVILCSVPSSSVMLPLRTSSALLIVAKEAL